MKCDDLRLRSTLRGVRLTANAMLLGVAMAVSVQAAAADLKVLKTGLGAGTVEGRVGSDPPTVSCGSTCNASYATAVAVNLTATGAPLSAFDGWDGACSGTVPTCSVTMSANMVVRARFRPSTAIVPIPLLTPTDINSYLLAQPVVDSPARFIAALPEAFRQNWILMARSESLQTGTARSPRILLASSDARLVFTVGMTTHPSHPGSSPNAIEFMQWDPTQKNFRFHEIVLATIQAIGTPGMPGYFPERLRGVKEDDPKCFACHSTRNVINNVAGVRGTSSTAPGAAKAKTKPNWDAYDSWSGALPFNRDRIHQGSLEAAAFKRLFNLWNWRGSDSNDTVRQVLEQLQLQPPAVTATSNHRITRDIDQVDDDAHIRFGFDGQTPLATTPGTTDYSFGGAPAAATGVNLGGRYVTMRHSAAPGGTNETLNSPGSDEGRGVQLFDLLGGLDGQLNAERIADELLSHPAATGNVALDVRPVALAITKGCFRVDAATNTVATTSGMPALAVNLAFFDARNGMRINDLVTDTRTRSESLPRRKADNEKLAFDRTGDPYLVGPDNGLIPEYGSGTPDGTTTSIARVRREVFRRAVDLGIPAVSVPGGVYVDREQYPFNTERVALYRYFLEPLGVSVDKWSMSVRGRSRTYTFADVFSTYGNVLASPLTGSLGLTPTTGCDAGLVNLVNSSLATLPAVDAVPTYTDVQRIFNKSCIECHGGLGYPPNTAGVLDLSEDETAVPGTSRLTRSHSNVTTAGYVTSDPATSFLYQMITRTGERCPPGATGMMPCGGPPLSKADVETVRRWIVGVPTTFSEGDPHMKTVDGVNYDFQTAGEFVLLRGENFELQARHTPVNTALPLGPDQHTGLTSCVSVNTAIAMRVGSHRVSYQPALHGEPDPSGLQLRIDGKAVRMGPRGIVLPDGGRVSATTAGGIRVELPGNSEVVVTPGWWATHQLWYLNVNATHMRATEGVIGVIGPGQWLPALPDGSRLGTRPVSLNQRFADLGRFADAWRVTGATSFFDYAPAQSTKNFVMQMPFEPRSCQTVAGPTGRPAMQPLEVAQAEKLCSNIKDAARHGNCIQDVRVTGEAGFAHTYAVTEQLDRNARPLAPTLLSPAHYFESLGRTVTLNWNRTVDPEGGRLSYRTCVWPVGERLSDNECEQMSPDAASRAGLLYAGPVGLLALLLVIALAIVGRTRSRPLWGLIAMLVLFAVLVAYWIGQREPLSATIAQLQEGRAYYWKVIAEDEQGRRTPSQTRRFSVK